MAHFFGYDPGGYRDQKKPEPTSGVVAAEIDKCGRITNLRRKTVVDSGGALRWFRQQPFAVALGIDTLLAWSFRGHRACDDKLKELYKGQQGSVQHQNSLPGSMAINGMLVAMKAHHEFGIPLAESHPKLLLSGSSHSGEALVPQHVVKKHEELKAAEGGQRDHQADALIAAWCASRWHFRDPDWTTDLYGVDPGDPLCFPAGPAVYPWPERITPSDGQSGESVAMARAGNGAGR